MQPMTVIWHLKPVVNKYGRWNCTIFCIVKTSKMGHVRVGLLECTQLVAVLARSFDLCNVNQWDALSMKPCTIQNVGLQYGTVATHNLCELASGNWTLNMAIEHGPFLGWIIPWQPYGTVASAKCQVLPWCGKRTPGAPSHLGSWWASLVGLVDREEWWAWCRNSADNVQATCKIPCQVWPADGFSA